MPALKVVLFAPSDTSIYPLLVAQLCLREPGVELTGLVILKVFNYRRLRAEFKRSGVLLLRKMWNKFVLHDSYIIYKEEKKSIDDFIQEVNPESESLTALARKYRIPLKKANELNDFAVKAFLDKCNPDLILCIGNSIIRRALLNLPKIGVLNVHMGLLPRYRGIGGNEWPIIEDRPSDLGITLHIMDEGVDTGPIIKSTRIKIKLRDTVTSLEVRYLPEMVHLMHQGVIMARDGQLRYVVQLPKDGKQYFALHPRIHAIVMKKLVKISSLL